MRSFRLRQLAPALAVALAACGGGTSSESSTPSPSGDPSSNPPISTGTGGGSSGGGGGSSSGGNADVQGLYAGTFSGSSGAIDLLMLEDGSYWALYGTMSGGELVVAGFLQGSGSASGSQFTSSDLRDFSIGPAATGSLAATFATSQSLSATVSESAGTASFDATPVPSSSFNYNTSAQLAAVQGTWQLTMLDGSVVGATISGTGALSTTSTGGCQFNGALAPRPSGKNVFNVSLSFGAAPCQLANETAAGVAVDVPLTGGGHQLIIAVMDASRNLGTAAFGLH